MTEAEDNAEIDPVEFLRRALAISPEDAAQVREDAAKRAPEDERRDRPPATDDQRP